MFSNSRFRSNLVEAGYVALLCGCLLGMIWFASLWSLILFGVFGWFLVAAPIKSQFLEHLRQATSIDSPVTVSVILLALLAYPVIVQGHPYLIHLGALSCIYVILAMGLNLTLGFVGQLDLGYAGYVCIGAYVSALLSMKCGFPFWVAMVVAGFFSSLAGLVISVPAARVKGHYLALVTLGFGQIVYILAKNLRSLTGGANGLRPIPPPRIGNYVFTDPLCVAGFQLPFNANFYFLCLLAACIIVVICNRLGRSRIGRIWASIRDDELAASVYGINIALAKTKAFAISAFLGGIGGALYAHMTNFIAPGDFSFFKSVIVVCMVILGGRGRIPRVILAAILLTMLPERLRVVGDMRLLVFGVAMLSITLASPRSITAMETRKLLA